jgi:hypothetical protein
MTAQPKWTEDDAYRAIGRYFCEFSQLVATMRSAMTRQIAADPPILGELVFGDTGARSIAESFFAMCRAVAVPEGAEIKVERELREDILKESRWRNDIAHGDWWPHPMPGTNASHVVRIRPMDKDPRKVIALTPDDLDKRSNDVIALGLLASEFWALCFHEDPYEDQTVRVGHILVLRDKNIRRAGERASEFPIPIFVRGASFAQSS